MGSGLLAAIGARGRMRALRVVAGLALALGAALVAALALASAPASAQETNRVLLYTGTTGFRHADAINLGRPVVQTALEAAGYAVDWEDCDNNGAGANNCNNADKNPRIFTDANLARYDAILLFNASAAWADGGRPGPLWNADQRAAIIRFVQQGGGIAANHNATDMAAGAVSWDWWDGGANSAVGSLMKGHAATDTNNVAQVEVADRHHLSTKDLPDRYGFGDEHYNFARSVRGTHHVLATLDERTYNPGAAPRPMGQDHPITWCKLYDGDNVNDGTGLNKLYNDGRVWVTGMGHFGSSYTANGGNNEIVKQIVGGVRWAAGEGKKSDCSGTVWSSFTRTTLVSDVNGPIGLDIAPDGKVYWSEIGPTQGFDSQGFIKMHDPTGGPNNKTTVATIPTRADHGNSEDGVLGMSLEPGFDLSNPEKRDVFVYYSPRNPAWPTTGNQIVVGYNQVSRFTLNEAGTAVEPNSERVILRVPKAKISGSPKGFDDGNPATVEPTDSGPGHVGGAGLDFDSEGNLYLGVGDDVSPNAGGHDRYAPMDYRAPERWDARKTSANTADLRGKVLRIRPLDNIPAGTVPEVDATYAIPAGNMFPVGMAQTRPEIYAMGFRQPFTIHTDAANPGNVVVGEYCHDNQTDGPKRAPAGVCEWNLVEGPSFQGWPFCMGDNSPVNTSWRWNYAANATTDSQYDCSLNQLPSDIDWAPAGQTAGAPTFDGLDTVPGPATPATIWRKYPGLQGQPVNAGLQSPADFGDLSAGGASPITGPVYRYDPETAQPGAFPPYYDGSWFIANRGDNGGFWKEVRLRKDNGKMLRVNDWVPTGQFGAPNNSFVIPTQFGPDGALYMARWSEGCCRNQLGAGTQTELVKVEFAVQDECLEDTQPPTVNHALAGRLQPGEATKYLQSATLTITAGDAGCAGVDTVEYRVGAGDFQPYSAPVEFDTPGDYTIEYRATDEFDNTSAVMTATFSVVEVDDDVAPTVAHTLSGVQDEDGHYYAPPTVSITATDEISPITSIEYRVNQVAEWTKTDYTGDVLTRALQAQFADAGFKYVEYRATDQAGNTSGIQTVSFSVVKRCTPGTDEFDGTALDSRWLRHTRNGGTPTTGTMAPTLASGQLTMKTNDLELDGSSGTTAGGPVNFIGQDLAALGNEWSVETQFTVMHTGGWQGVGLMVWQGDNNFFRSTITNNLNGSGGANPQRLIFLEQSKDNPTTAEGSRVQSSGNHNLPAGLNEPVTIRMRYSRAAGSNSVIAQYRIMAPETVANPDWVTFGATNATWINSGGLDLNPAGGPRRDSAGSRVGIYAGGNFPGSTGAFAYSGTPANVVVDYFRVTPDTASTCPDDDVEPPATTATLNPAQPGAGGTYNVPVEVDLAASDAGGVAATQYRVDDGDWTTGTTVRVRSEGRHTVQFRSEDQAGNLEVPEQVSFTIANLRDVFAAGTTWEPNDLSVSYGETVTWHFEDPPGAAHNVWLTPPGGTMELLSALSVPAGGDPVSYTFRKAGTWTFVCSLHDGMTGTVDVGNSPDPGPGPKPGGTPPKPGPGLQAPPPLPPPTATAAQLGKLPKTKLSSFLKKGLRISSKCESGLRGSVKVLLSRKEARKLRLKKATTLASKTVVCGANDTVAVRLKPSKRMKKALRKARKSVTVTVKIAMGSGSEATSSSRKLVLRK